MHDLESLFAEALSITRTDARARWMDEHTAGDLALRQTLQEMVAAATGEEAAQRQASNKPPGAEAPAAAPGKLIGAYRVERTLGSGGMGTIYLGRRQTGDVDLLVAIKVLSAAVGSERFLRYFEEERKILATLVHPNVTRFLDAGALPDGAPYLVMEYVDGQPLHEYQDSRRLDLPGRLALFRKVCTAVSFLHQNLILHRDLKPGNILVTPNGEPMLLDFGAAKILERADPAQTIAPLTPRYASPEQARGNPVTTQSDVFSLGVILYESLTGAWPFGDPTSPGAAIDRFRGIPAPLPPTMVITETAAEARAATMAGLGRSLSGDLSRIVLKALAGEPAERYESAAALSEDLRRYLGSEPVLAQAPSWLYRCGKFVRRNRGAVALACAMALAICGAGGAAIWQARVAQQARELAERRFQDVRKLTRLVLFDFHDQLAKVPGAMGLQESLIAQTLTRFESLARESGGDPGILAELGEGYLRLGDIQGNPYLNNRGNAVAAVVAYKQGLALLGHAASGSASVDLAVGRLRRSLGRTLASQGKTEEALTELRAGVTSLERAGLAAPSSESELQLMHTKVSIGDILFNVDPQKALAMYDEAMLVIDRFERLDPASAPGAVTLYYKRGNCQEMLGNTGAAIELYRQGLAAYSRLPEEARNATGNQRARASLLSILGSSLADLDQGDEALRMLTESVAISRALSEADPTNSRARFSVAANLNNRNIAYRALRRGEELFLSQLEEEAAWNALLATSQSPMYQSGAAMNLDSLSQAFLRRGDKVKAAAYARRALDMLAGVVAKSPNPEDRRRYAAALLKTGAPGWRDPTRALEQMELAMRETAQPSEDVLIAYGLALLHSGKPAEAVAPLEKCIASMAAQLKGRRESVNLEEARLYLKEAKILARR